MEIGVEASTVRKEVHKMMKKIVVLCMVLVIALSFGCSKKKEEPPKPEGAAVQQQPKELSIYDPVSKEEVSVKETAYSYEYNGVVYPFASAENMEAFKADPEKYLKDLTKPEAPKPEGQ